MLEFTTATITILIILAFLYGISVRLASNFGPYVGRYFAEFQFRFNGRHDLPGLFTDLLAAAARATPRTHQAVTLA